MLYECAVCDWDIGVSPLDEEGDVVVEDGEDHENEERVPRVARPPREPSRLEREQHEISHLPPRDWCAHCRRGRGVKGAHYRGRDTDHDFPTISIDYAYIGSSPEDDEKLYMDAKGRADRGVDAVEDVVPRGSVCTLVVHDSRSGGIYGVQVDRKGVSARVQAKLIEILNTLGYKRVVLKSDQEPSIIALKRSIQQLWEMGEATLEDSPAYDPKSNGAVERSVRTLKEQVRTMKSDLEDRVGRKLTEGEGEDRNLLCWMIEHAGCLLRRFKIGSDGRTAYERIKGRKSNRSMVPFGECLWWMPLRPQSREPTNLDPRVEEGCFMGIREVSDEALIMTPQGLVKCRDVRRRPEPERWSDVLLKKIVGTPCEPNPGSQDMRIKTIRAEPGALPRRVESDGRPQQTRRMRLMKKDFQEFDYTEGCPGCDTMRSGRTVQIRRGEGVGTTVAHKPHNKKCRDRIYKRLLETEAGRDRLTKDDDRVMEDIAAREEVREQEDQEMQDGQGFQAGDHVVLTGLVARNDLERQRPEDGERKLETDLW